MIQKITRLTRKGVRYLCDPDYRFLLHSGWFHCYDAVSDDEFLRRKFKASFGRELDLENPMTFNEKLQWLKLYDRNPVYNVMVDKHLVKEYVAGLIGAQYIVPTLGVWDDPDQIDFEALPDRFALKCNHNSGLGMYICHDKADMDVDKVKKELRKGMMQDYYLTGREWPYKDVPRKIIAEQYMESDESGLTDYKIHCFNGKPRFVLVCKDRFTATGLTEDFFTPSWEHLSVRRPTHPHAATPVPCPAELDEMLHLAETLSADIPFVRVDFYIIDHQVYFSELTFFPASGFEGYDPPEWDQTFGKWLELPEK